MPHASIHSHSASFLLARRGAGRHLDRQAKCGSRTPENYRSTHRGPASSVAQLGGGPEALELRLVAAGELAQRPADAAEARQDEGRLSDILLVARVGAIARLCQLDRVGHGARRLCIEEAHHEERRRAACDEAEHPRAQPSGRRQQRGGVDGGDAGPDE
eukprot:scaffold11710_cov127-Isochrysis_galbana.AAC.5